MTGTGFLRAVALLLCLFAGPLAAQTPPPPPPPGNDTPEVPPPLPPADVGISYYLIENGAQAGPFDDAQLRFRAQAGTLTADTLVWTAGMEGWQRAGEVVPLRALLAERPAVPEAPRAATVFAGDWYFEGPSPSPRGGPGQIRAWVSYAADGSFSIQGMIVDLASNQATQLQGAGRWQAQSRPDGTLELTLDGTMLVTPPGGLSSPEMLNSTGTYTIIDQNTLREDLTGFLHRRIN